MVEIALKQDLHKQSVYVLESINNTETVPHRLRMFVKSHVWRPPTDVFENDENIVVRVEIAGVQEENFVIILEGRNLTIRGLRPDLPERRAYHQMEIRFGEFVTEIELPHPVDTERIEAIYQLGFLRITLPKIPPVHVQVKE